MNCQLCESKGLKSPAVYDAKTQMGLWAYLCALCHKKYGVGLGLGKGSKLN